MKTHHDDGQSAALAIPDAGEAQMRLRKLAALPPLPRRSQELLRLLSDPDLDILRLIELIEQTPALAARIMGVAASPYFMGGAPPRHVSDAVVRLLGLNLTRDLSMSFILSQPFRMRASARFEPLRYWRRAMESAAFAQALAPSVAVGDGRDLSSAYLAGLLHSLGLLALANVAREEMDAVFLRAESEPEGSLRAIERELLGLDHAQAGGVIAAAWHLPAPIAAAMTHHGNPAYRGSAWPLAALVTLANCVSHSRHEPDGPSRCAEAHAALLDALRIRPAQWANALQRWELQIQRIERLAAVFAGDLS